LSEAGGEYRPEDLLAAEPASGSERIALRTQAARVRLIERALLALLSENARLSRPSISAANDRNFPGQVRVNELAEIE
jgi:hypothetical protein